MTTASVTVSREVADIVRPAWLVLEALRVVDVDPRLDGPLQEAAARMRVAVDRQEITKAVRTMYKRLGLDPTKVRPSSEALLRRVCKGHELPRVNSLVDLVNWSSLETRLPFGLYDMDRIRGTATMRLGLPGEAYRGIRKDHVHLEGRLTLADDDGPFGNPTSDSARTMVTGETTRALVVVFAPRALGPTAGDEAAELTRNRVGRFAVVSS